MEATQHTPGEWRAYIIPLKKEDGNIHPGGGYISAPTDQRIFGRDPRKIIAYLPHWYNEKEQAEIEANAELISAAPKIVAERDELKAKLETIKTDADTVHRLMTLLSHGANVSPQSLERAEKFFKKLKTL